MVQDGAGGEKGGGGGSDEQRCEGSGTEATLFSLATSSDFCCSSHMWCSLTSTWNIGLFAAILAGGLPPPLPELDAARLAPDKVAMSCAWPGPGATTLRRGGADLGETRDAAQEK